MRINATSTATIRTPNSATTQNNTTRQLVCCQESITANAPNIANTNNSSSCAVASETWVDSWVLLRLATTANARPPVNAATNPLACTRSPNSKQISATARVASCAQVSLIQSRRRDHAISTAPSSPIAAPMTSETNSVRTTNQVQSRGR